MSVSGDNGRADDAASKQNLALALAADGLRLLILRPQGVELLSI